MVKTLLLYDGKMSSAERIANRLSYLIGNAKVTELSEAPDDISAYGGFCFVFNFYGAVTAGKISSYLRANKTLLEGARIALIGIGFSDLGFMNYVVTAEKSTGLRGIEGYFLNNDAQALRVGTEIGKMMQAPSHAMDEDALFTQIDQFISSHNTLALASSTEDFVRCTPLEYLYTDHVFYIITEGGNKFRGIMENGRVSAAIFDPYTDMKLVKGLQINAEAKIIPAGSPEYLSIMEKKNISQEDLQRMPVTLFLIKLIPLRYEYLDTSLMQDGLDSHQMMTTQFQKETWQAGAAFHEAAAKAQPEETPEEETAQKTADTEAARKGSDEELRQDKEEMSAREARSIIHQVAGDAADHSADEANEEEADETMHRDMTEKEKDSLMDGLEDKITRFLRLHSDDEDDDYEYDGSLLDEDDELDDFEDFEDDDLEDDEDDL